MKLDKSQAIERRNQQLDSTVLNRDNTHFAVLDPKRNIWWFDLPFGQIKTCEWINLLLHTPETDQLLHLKVPSNFLRAHRDEVEMRHAGKRNMSVSLELSADRDSYLQDLRPKGGQLAFAVFVQV